MSPSEILASCAGDPRVALCVPWPAALGGPLLPVHWYAILILTAIALGAAFALIHTRREGEQPAAVLNALVWIVPGAFLGARLMFVAVETLGGDGRYLADPLQILNFRGGGSNWFGVLAAGSLIVVYLARRARFDLWLAADVGALGLWAGQGVGRFANLVNLEAYGPPTGSNWFGLIIPAPFRYPPYSDLALYPPATRFHATMLYESIWLLASFIAMYLVLMRRRDLLRRGSLIGLYLVVGGVGRFIAENWRPDQARILGTGVSFARLLAAVEIGLGLGLVIYRSYRLRQTAGISSNEDEANTAVPEPAAGNGQTLHTNR